jgi:hypothetical protein
MQSSGEHAFTFSELERLMTEEDIDLDQINLLLDIIQVPFSKIRVALEPMGNKDSPNYSTISNKSSTPFFQPCIDTSCTPLSTKKTSSLNQPTNISIKNIQPRNGLANYTMI